MRFIKLLTVYCLLFAVLSACAKDGKDKVEETLISKPAPDFRLTELHGMEYKLSGMKGKVVLLRFWSTRCVSCKEEMRKLEASYQSLKDKGFEILAVNVEDPRDKAMNFAHKLKLTYPILLDEDQKVAGKYMVYSIPTSFFIDKQGVVREKILGDLDEEKIEKIVVPLFEDKEIATAAAKETKGIFLPLQDKETDAKGGVDGEFSFGFGGAKGGDFTLTSHKGEKVSLRNFMGKAVIIFFGYTNCPDICSTGLRSIDSALKLLGKRSDEVQVLFISVDPARDTPERLKEYVPYFNPSFIGLTGTKEEIDKVVRQYGAMYSLEEPDENGYYAVGHTTSIYLIDREGSLKYVFPFYTPRQEMAKVIKEYM